MIINLKNCCMKKLFAIAVLFVMSVGFVSAQGFQNSTPEERAKMLTDRMNELLSLTADQKTKVEAINLDYSKKLSEQMTAAGGDRDAMRSKMQEMNTERDKKFKEILTADQFKKYSDDQAERQRQRGF